MNPPNLIAGRLVAVLLAITCCLTSTVYSDQPTPVFVPGQFVVKLSGRVPAGMITQSLTTDHKLERPTALQIKPDLAGAAGWNRTYLLTVTDSNLTAQDLRQQLGIDNVEYVEPVCMVESFDYPSDPLFAHQWYLQNIGQEYWAVDRREGPFNDTLVLKTGAVGADIDLEPYYQQTPEELKPMVVAVVDTGVDPEHPDLQGMFWQNPDEIPSNGIDDDHNGFIDDTIGYDLSGDSLLLFNLQPDNDPSDFYGHGTHIAGIIAAAHNDLGISGVAPNAKIMAVKMQPNGTTVVGAASIIYAVNSGANVINVSWGTPFESLILREALQFAQANGVLVCASSGNTGGAHQLYPSSFEEAFTVGATNADGHLTGFSTYGPQVDIVAPGQNILSLRATGTDMYFGADEPGVHIVGDDSLYYLADGTSMAAPMVAGAAALIWSLRPHLTLEQLRNDLLLGARDILDPYGIGDSLPGRDDYTGYGALDIQNALDLPHNGGLFFVSPGGGSRLVGSADIRVANTEGYTGGWGLAYERSTEPGVWVNLGQGAGLPPDSVVATLSGAGMSDRFTLRLTDDYGVEQYLSFFLVTESRLQITSPITDQELDYNIPVIGSVYGPDYRSLRIYARRGGAARELIYETGAEFFDSLIYSWNASGVELGDYTLYIEASFDSGDRQDSVHFVIASAFAAGWPQGLSGRGGLSPVAADLDGDGPKEIIVGTSYGLNVFSYNGQPRDGFPTLIGTPVRCIPALYDIDDDGLPEIICTSDSAIHAFNGDGSPVPGWPVKYYLDFSAYGSPSPVITELGPDQDTAIVLYGGNGEIMAYEFDGSSYFYSLEGWFGSFNQEPTPTLYYNGNALSGVDLDGDGANELVATYAAERNYSGVAVFNGRTGQPAFDRALPYTVEASNVFGTVLADLDGDDLPEIITSGYETGGQMKVWVKKYGVQDLPGWPQALPGLDYWIGTYPVVADLDLDGIPEILVTYYEFDIGTLYVFRADGTPYRSIEGRPPGEAFRVSATLGAPIVADLVGDEHMEVIIRSGRILPGSGREEVHILDYTLEPVPGWPISTPTPSEQVFSTPYAPMVDDIDDDGLVELLLIGDGLSLFVWDFETSYNNGLNTGRLFHDNLNSSVFPKSQIVTDVDDGEASLPQGYELFQNYPNPFNPATAITFQLPYRQAVKLDVFNVLGQRVITIVDQELPAGNHTVTFDGTSLASGIYLYRLHAQNYVSTRKMVLLK